MISQRNNRSKLGSTYWPISASRTTTIQLHPNMKTCSSALSYLHGECGTGPYSDTVNQSSLTDHNYLNSLRLAAQTQVPCLTERVLARRGVLTRGPHKHLGRPVPASDNLASSALLFLVHILCPADDAERLTNLYPEYPWKHRRRMSWQSVTLQSYKMGQDRDWLW